MKGYYFFSLASAPPLSEAEEDFLLEGESEDGFDEECDYEGYGDGTSEAVTSGWCTSDPDFFPSPTPEDVQAFEAGMAVNADTVSGSSIKKGQPRSGRRQKVNCCQTLLKQCLDLIDAETSTIIKSEDFEGT